MVPFYLHSDEKTAEKNAFRLEETEVDFSHWRPSDYDDFTEKKMGGKKSTLPLGHRV